jgi:hypothetical protein
VVVIEDDGEDDVVVGKLLLELEVALGLGFGGFPNTPDTDSALLFTGVNACWPDDICAVMSKSYFPMN